MGRSPADPAQQKEAIRRHVQGVTVQALADSYDRSISIMRRATRRPTDIVILPVEQLMD